MKLTNNHWNRLKVTHATLGERKVLRQVQAQFEQAEKQEKVTLDDLIDILPVGCWSLNNIRGILSLNLHTHQLHSTPCMFIRSFEGRTLSEVRQKYLDWKHVEDTKNHPSLF